jgi:hypothetical protein
VKGKKWKRSNQTDSRGSGSAMWDAIHLCLCVCVFSCVRDTACMMLSECYYICLTTGAQMCA